MKNLINVKIVNDYLTKNNMTKTDFCKHCHIADTIFNKIFIKDSNISIVSLFKIARAMNMSITQLCGE